MSRIYVTGLGVISAIGNTAAENQQALRAGRSGISKAVDFPSKYAGVLPFGEVKLSTAALQQKLDAFEPGVTRTNLLALHAFNEAVAASGLTGNDLTAFDTALIGATTVSGMCLTDEMYSDANTSTGGSPYLSSYEYAAVNMYLQKRFGFTGIINTINTACSSSANAIMYGARLIKSGQARRAVVGGADSLAKFTINGFNALHILAPELCRPFDAQRKGLNLGEAAAFLVLENEADAAGKKVYAEVAGYSNTNDAFHPSSLSEQGDGPYLAMQQALAAAGLQPQDIGFINAHGTATENNDETESRAMLRLFGTPPPFASTKGNTAHTLGAAGSLEAIFSIFNLTGQEVYPSLNFAEPIAGTGLVPVQQYQSVPLRHVMSNSFGFGGNCSSLIFSKV